MIGMIPNTPGPDSFRNRPKRSTTARSQGDATLTALDTSNAATNAAHTMTVLPMSVP